MEIGIEGLKKDMEENRKTEAMVCRPLGKFC